MLFLRKANIFLASRTTSLSLPANEQKAPVSIDFLLIYA